MAAVLSAFHWRDAPSEVLADPSFKPKVQKAPGAPPSGSKFKAQDQRGRAVVDMAPRTAGAICIEPRGGSDKRRRLAKGRAI